MKRAHLTGIACLLLGIVYFHCTSPSSIVNNNTGGSEVVGTLVLKAGGAAKYAHVKAYTVVSSTGLDSLTDSTIADTVGNYQFDSLKIGRYDFECKAVSNQDTFYASIKDLHLDSVAPPKQAPYKYPLGVDTMYRPGSISGQVKVNYPVNLKHISCNISGTSYNATADDTGAFKISNIPKGTYAVSFMSTGTDFNVTDVQVQNIVVRPELDTNIGIIQMYLSGIGNPPMPLGFKYTYDTSAGQVILSWDTVPVPDFKNYLVIRQDSNFATGLLRKDSTFTTRTSLIDTITFNDTLGYSISYSVQCFDISGHFSDPSQSIAVNVKPPVDKTIVNLTGPDSAGIFDRIAITATFTNITTPVKTITWTTVNGDSVHTINKNFGTDALITSFSDTGKHAIYFTAIDNLGRTSKDSAFVTIVRDKPVIKYLSPSQTIDFGGTVQCSLAVAHQFGACTLIVHLGKLYADVKLTYKNTGKDSIIIFDTAFSTVSEISWDSVKIKVTDNHGNSVDTGFAVTVRPHILPDEWVKLKPMNFHHFLHSSAVINNTLYVIGGEMINPANHTPQSVSAVESFDTVNGWVNQNPLLKPQDNLSTCIYNNNIYSFAGNNQNYGYISLMERFDPQSKGGWTISDSMYIGKTPFFRKNCASCILKDNLYLFGGLSGDRGDTVCRDIYVYSFSSKTWSKISQPMLSSRCNFQAMLLGTKIYLIGGIDSTYNAVKTIEIFDPTSQRCSPGPNMPYALSSFASVAIDTKFYIIGGLNSQFEPINSVYIYDINLQTWTSKHSLPEPRQSLSASVLNGNIFVTGGIVSQEPVLGQTSDQDVLEYYP
jgi:hypothetical protein